MISELGELKCRHRVLPTCSLWNALYLNANNMLTMFFKKKSRNTRGIAISVTVTCRDFYGIAKNSLHGKDSVCWSYRGVLRLLTCKPPPGTNWSGKVGATTGNWLNFVCLFYRCVNYRPQLKESELWFRSATAAYPLMMLMPSEPSFHVNIRFRLITFTIPT